MGDVVRAIEDPYLNKIAPGTGERPLSKRFVDDSKVTDHHAIIPTPTSPAGADLFDDERKIYDLICRRLLSAWHDDHVWSVTTVITAIGNPPPSGIGEPFVDRYHSTGTLIDQVGWKVLDIERKKKKEPKEGKDEKRREGTAEGRRQRRAAPVEGKPGPALRADPGAAAGRARRARRGQADPAAQALHRGNAAHRHGDGRPRPWTTRSSPRP